MPLDVALAVPGRPIPKYRGEIWQEHGRAKRQLWRVHLGRLDHRNRPAIPIPAMRNALWWIFAAFMIGAGMGFGLAAHLFRPQHVTPPAIVRDSLYWKDVERSADSLFGTIDTITKVDTVWLTKTRGYVTSLAPDSLIAIHLLPPSTRRADTTGNAR